MLSSSVFDRPFKIAQKDASSHHLSKFDSDPIDYSYFNTEIATRLIERLEDIRSRDFTLALDLGSKTGEVLKAINREESLSGNGGGIGGVRKLVMVEGSKGMRSLVNSGEILFVNNQLSRLLLANL